MTDDLKARLRSFGHIYAYEAADRIEALELALTQSRAETAAAYERAAGLPRYAPNSFGFMNPSDRGCWVHHGDIRALATPDQTAALDAVRAEAMREAAEIAASEEMIVIGRKAADDKYYEWRGLGPRKEGEGLDGMHFIVRAAITAILAAIKGAKPARAVMAAIEKGEPK